MATYELDARRLLCPMPVIKTQNLANKLENADIIRVVTTDPGAKEDLPCWIRINHHQLISMCEINGEIHITLQLKKE